MAIVVVVAMKAICGSCHRSFPGIGAAFMIWCKEDEMYVCERCWFAHCKSGHMKGFRNQGNNLITWTLFVSVFIGMLLGAGFPVFYDVYLHSQWDDLEPTPIVELEDGETVRIEGIINASTDTVAIGGEEKRSGKDNYYWEWNENDEFYVSDSNGSVLVTTRGFYEIERAPHVAPNRDRTEGRAYMGGDELIIIGDVGTRGNETIVHLRWVGTDEDDIPPTTLSLLGVGLILSFTLFVYGWIGMLSIKRRRLHREKVDFDDFDPVIDDRDPMDMSLDWRKNASMSRRTTKLIVFMLMTFGMMILVAFHNFMDIHEKDEMFLYMVPIMFGPVMMILFPIRSYLEQRWIKPDLIAVSDEGIHFHYDKPLVRSFKLEFIPWDRIDFVGIKKTGTRRGRMIRLKDTTIIHMANLTPQNINYLQSEYDNFRGDQEELLPMD